MEENVKEQDLALIYSGSHGGSDEKRGFCLYANGGTVYGDEIKSALAKVKGRVVLVIQACHAGDLLVKHRADLEAMPKNVAAVCACRAGQSSHGIMLPPIMEALHGWADADSDGLVSVAKFLLYVDHRIGDFYPGKWAKSQHAVTAEPTDFDLSMPLARDAPHKKPGKGLVMVVYKNNWYGGLVLPKKDPTNQGRRWVHYFGDEEKEDAWVEDSRICPHGLEAVDVRKGDKWYTAVLLKPDGDHYLIRYVDSLDDKEEAVSKNRLRALSLDKPGATRKKRGNREATRRSPP